ncbi:MAG: Glyoxalase/bleomycin resistance protein/dioxygenase [Acidimicrobiales bacterium]|nr:Glyoxalase/bleomycin resistance protein/dioxygenase [Acidimicrobiales bacterium]
MAVNHVGHCVRDLAVAQRFYVEMFGFRMRNELAVPDAAASPLLRVPEPVGLYAVYLELDGFVLELLHFDRAGNSPRRDRDLTEPGLTHLSFAVDDLDAACARVADLGGEVLEDTVVAHRAVMIRDPDGQLLELLQLRWGQRRADVGRA